MTPDRHFWGYDFLPACIHILIGQMVPGLGAGDAVIEDMLGGGPGAAAGSGSAWTSISSSGSSAKGQRSPPIQADQAHALRVAAISLIATRADDEPPRS